MNKSKIFKMAHQITKQTLRENDGYRATFALTLKAIFKEMKEAQKRHQELAHWAPSSEEIKEEIATCERRMQRKTISINRALEMAGRIGFYA